MESPSVIGSWFGDKCDLNNQQLVPVTSMKENTEQICNIIYLKENCFSYSNLESKHLEREELTNNFSNDLF